MSALTRLRGAFDGGSGSSSRQLPLGTHFSSEPTGTAAAERKQAPTDAVRGVPSSAQSTSAAARLDSLEPVDGSSPLLPLGTQLSTAVRGVTPVAVFKGRPVPLRMTPHLRLVVGAPPVLTLGTLLSAAVVCLLLLHWKRPSQEYAPLDT